MITILHGDNTIKSREKLVEIINAAKGKNIKIIRLEAKKLTEPRLEENLLSESLFLDSKLVIIEELHSLPRSKKKNNLIDMIAKSKTEIVLWEKRQLTATMLKKFSQAKVFQFKLSRILFTWLDSLNPQKKQKKKQLELLQQTTQYDDEWICFSMLIRQIRLMIQAKEGAKIKGAPFMITKLKKQAQAFSLTKLIQIHKQLLKIDLAHKSSNNYLDLAQDLNILTLNL
ncbi:MAG: hypothetical protein PVJ09_01375 [Candidatus Woesebacteria bacterium]|jgi:hypothetical protein